MVYHHHYHGPNKEEYGGITIRRQRKIIDLYHHGKQIISSSHLLYTSRLRDR